MGRISTMSVVNAMIDFASFNDKLADIDNAIATATAKKNEADANIEALAPLLKTNKDNAALAAVVKQAKKNAADAADALAALAVERDAATAANTAIAAYGDIKPLMLALFNHFCSYDEISKEDTDKRRAEYIAALNSGIHAK